MTFEQALKRLAEKEAEKFEMRESVMTDSAEIYEPNAFAWRQDCAGIDGWQPQAIKWLTQDDIDEILALIGRGYVVYADMTGKQSSLKGYGFSTLTKISDGRTYSNNFLSKTFSTKLLAAKAALIAVVEREYP